MKKRKKEGGGFVQNMWYDLITWEVILAKYPTGGLTRGKRRKLGVKMAKKPTSGHSMGEKKKIKSKNGKKTYWRTYKG